MKTSWGNKTLRLLAFILIVALASACKVKPQSGSIQIGGVELDLAADAGNPALDSILDHLNATNGTLNLSEIEEEFNVTINVTNESGVNVFHFIFGTLPYGQSSVGGDGGNDNSGSEESNNDNQENDTAENEGNETEQNESSEDDNYDWESEQEFMSFMILLDSQLNESNSTENESDIIDVDNSDPRESVQEVPEFGTLAALAVLLGAGYMINRKRR